MFSFQQIVVTSLIATPLASCSAIDFKRQSDNSHAAHTPAWLGWSRNDWVYYIFFPYSNPDGKPGAMSYRTQRFRNYKPATSIMSPSSTSASLISTSLSSFSPSTTSRVPEVIMALLFPRFRPFAPLSYSRYSFARPAFLR